VIRSKAVAQRLEQPTLGILVAVRMPPSGGSPAGGGGSLSAADILAFNRHKCVARQEGLGGVALSERILSASRPNAGGMGAAWANGRTMPGLDGRRVVAMNPVAHDGRRLRGSHLLRSFDGGLRCSLNCLDAVGGAPARLALDPRAQAAALAWSSGHPRA